jgi:protein-S-isoprenylcysteine O-methyltransferase Ste14
MSGSTVGKLAYGFLFVVAVPALLLGWAAAAAPVVPLPVIPYPEGGYVLLAFGVALIAAGMVALMVHGRGLPMNPFPPTEYVRRGIYRYTAHPIYVGFVSACLGVAIFMESPSGIWLVTPMVALAAAALVLGFERHDLRRRFGPEAIHRPLISLPPDGPNPPSGWNRASIYILVLIPWSVAFEAVYRLGVPADAVVAYLPFENDWPVLEWTEAVYGSIYLFVLAAPLIVPTQRALRRLAMLGLISTAVVTLIYLTVPLIAPPRPFEPQTFLGHALMFERAMSNTVAAFPAFHVIWSFIAADAWASRSRGWAIAGWAWAILIAISCITTGMHALADIAAATVVFVLLLQSRRIWELMRRAAESIADSWREWRWGGVRLINHGFYAGLAGAVGFWVAASLGGPDVFWQLVFVHVCGLLGAGLWAQKLEGSPKLSRPFGYYGGVIGCIAGAIVAGAIAGNTILLFALITMEAPWLQSIGRLRCLVQGCCHGAEASEAVGIRYSQPRSRVCVLGDLRGVPLHPTPLYSILGNFVIGVLLLRLWSLGASYGIIAGVYLMLAGIARFVEESYRGEPQTMIVGGLRIYQWMAVLSFAFGIVLTMIPGGQSPGLAFALDARVAVAGLLYGLLTGFAMGVDFPGSARRFARLASP